MSELPPYTDTSEAETLTQPTLPSPASKADEVLSSANDMDWQDLLDKLSNTSSSSPFGSIHGQTPRAVLIRQMLKDYTIPRACIAASLFLTREDTFEMYQSGTYPDDMNVPMESYFDSCTAHGYIGDAMRDCISLTISLPTIHLMPHISTQYVVIMPLITPSSIIGVLLLAFSRELPPTHPLHKLYGISARQFAHMLYQDQLERRIRVVETELGQTVAARTIAVTQSKRELQSIIDSIQAGIIIIDEKQQTITGVNPSALAIMECDDIEIIGQSSETLFVPISKKTAPLHRSYEILHCPSGKDLFVVRRTSRIRSSQQWLRIESFVDMSEQVIAEQRLQEANALLERRVQDRTNELQKTVLQLRGEIQQRKDAQVALARNELFLNLIFDSISVAVCLNDERGKYMRFNKAFLSLHGYTPEELHENDYRLFLRGDDLARVRSVFRDFMTSSVESTECEFQLHGKYGTVRHVHVISSKFEIDGTPFIVSGVHDISDRKRAEEEIAEALTRERELGELKSRFITLVSHEFRTPLTTIYSSAQLLEKNRSRWSMEKQSAYLNDIATCVMRLRDILNDILYFSKAESGKLKLTPTLLNVWDTCTDISDSLVIGRDHTSRIKLHIEGEATACVDRAILRHILQNLLSNGLKYSPPHKHIDCIILVGTMAMDITVRDYGIGLPEDEVANLFQPFFRASNVGDINGTGMGLSLVHQMVQTHHGTISVESTQNVGTTFRVHLPFLS